MAAKPNEARNRLALRVIHQKIRKAIEGDRQVIFADKEVIVYAIAERRECENGNTVAPANAGTLQQVSQLAG